MFKTVRLVGSSNTENESAPLELSQRRISSSARSGVETGMPRSLLKYGEQALPLIMLCGVSVRFNVLGDEVLGGVSGKRSPEDRELLVGFQATEALSRFQHSSGSPA
jgi:hypothetical protein